MSSSDPQSAAPGTGTHVLARWLGLLELGTGWDGAWPHLVTAELLLSHSSEASGAQGRSTYSTAAALQRGLA